MAQLIAIEADSRRTLPLASDPVIVGRSESCALRLSSPGVSRQHCRIAPGGGGWELEDLGSQNGTKVNGRRVARHRLEDGDRIQFGEAVVLFEAAGRRGRTRVHDPALDSTRSLSRSIYGAAPGDEAGWKREREQLLRLADVTIELARAQDLQGLLDRIMDSAVALAGAQRGFIILTGDDTFEFVAGCNIDREQVRGSAFEVSRSVVSRVVQSGEPVLLGDAGADAGFADARSIMDLGLKSVLAVPLAVAGRAFGAVYLDHAGRTNAFGPGELRLLHLFGSQAAVAIEQARLQAQAASRAALAHEYQLAGRIQARLLPKEPPPVKGAQVHGVTVPATAMSGDYFDLLPLWDGGCDLVVADVAGKGLAAGLVMVNARAVLRSLAQHAPGPRQVLAQLHKVIRPDLEARLFIAVTMARWDPKGGVLTIGGAGQGPLLYYRAKGKQVEEVATGGIVIGAPKKDIKSLLAEHSLTLAKGDAVLFFSDGATEARGAGDAEFGRDRLAAALRRHGAKPPADCIAGIQSEIAKFVGDREPHDDVTLVVLRRA